MSFKGKIMNMITAHQRLVTLGIGLAVTFVVGTAIGMIEHNQVLAHVCGPSNCKGGGIY